MKANTHTNRERELREEGDMTIVRREREREETDRQAEKEIWKVGEITRVQRERQRERVLESRGHDKSTARQRQRKRYGHQGT